MKTPISHPVVNHVLARHGIPPKYVTTFDASTVLQRALAAFLRGEDFEAGAALPWGGPLGRATLCALPNSGRSLAYQLGARADAVNASALSSFHSETVSRWVTSSYPRRRTNLALVGASNGAAVQLAAALGAPWLPQDHLVLVRTRGLDPDGPTAHLELGERLARSLLSRAPDLTLHQMHDPVQHRLTSRQALHFRLKRRTLGPTYERFLLDRLEPGGTLVLVDCRATWPVVEVADRHLFQLGGLGAFDPEDYYGLTDRTRAFLASQRSAKGRWIVPRPEAERSEAEWGYAPELTADVLRFADRHGYRVERLSFRHPEHLSPWVADLYRLHVTAGSGAPDRLLIESNLLVDPACVRRTASVPFWTTYNARSSVEAVQRYLRQSHAFDDIRAVLYSGGVRAPDTATVEEWQALLFQAREGHGLLGVHPNRYPADFAVYLRHHQALERLPDAPRRPRDLTWRDVRAYAEGTGAKHPVQLERLCD